MEQIGLVQYRNPGESKIHNKSATNLQQVQNSTANPQQIHNKSTTRRKVVQHVVQQSTTNRIGGV